MNNYDTAFIKRDSEKFLRKGDRRERETHKFANSLRNNYFEV